MSGMRFYLAARFPRRAEMEVLADELKAKLPGSECVARWVYGGEEGLDRRQIALIDLEDVDKANTVILFTHPRGSKQTGGGRFIEFGYAIAKKKRLIVIGDYENVFISHPSVLVYKDWAEFLHNEVPVEPRP